ncbi:MAG TPA: 50S ribosomal protein L5 [Candidatus Lokiarchaeia archaeon]|nr:50S ribosomal protein L5 [Candidatus Lokiarchaeia archaeon]
MSQQVAQIKNQDIHKLWDANPNMRPRLDKIVVNLAVGQSGETLQKAAQVVEEMTQQKPSLVGAHRSIKEFNIRQGEKIAARVTLRGEPAVNFLKKALVEHDFKILRKSFDNYGNVSWGVKEHINIPGLKYDPSIGIFGFEISVKIIRAGQRVRVRKARKAKLPKKQYVTKQEAMLFLEEQFKAEIVETIETNLY